MVLVEETIAATWSFIVPVEPRDFEAALVKAVEHTDHRLRFRNLHLRPADDTSTGWQEYTITSSLPVRITFMLRTRSRCTAIRHVMLIQHNHKYKLPLVLQPEVLATTQ